MWPFKKKKTQENRECDQCESWGTLSCPNSYFCYSTFCYSTKDKPYRINPHCPFIRTISEKIN